MPGDGDFAYLLVPSDGKPSRRWRASKPDLKVKVVCESCNSKWMSHLETEAKPILGPLIRGDERILSREDQRKIAIWAIKTAMMWQFMSHIQPISSSIMRELYEDSATPPGNAQVWIGACLAEAGYSYPVSLTVKPKGASSDAAVNAYGATFSIGHAAFQVFGHELPGVRGGRRFADGSRLAHGLLPIWPFAEVATFPTAHVWTLGQLEEIGRHSWGPDLPKEATA